MNKLIRTSIAGQFGAGLRMLENCLTCTDDVTWLAPVGRYPFWQVAYHTLFVTDMYLCPDERQIRPQPFHRKDYNLLGPTPWAPNPAPADQPYDRDTLVGYVRTCRANARRSIEGESDDVLAGPSGFSWLPITRLELHLYNVRHLQHHTGQLSAALRRHTGEGVRWSLTEALT
jgi:hypothetical protein